jgi:uncharacterized protein YkwD
MHFTSRRLPFPALLIGALALALGGCGGGGGGGDSATAITAASVAPSSPSAFDTSRYANAPVSTGNVAVDGRNWINYRRSQVGIAALVDNSSVARAAQSHSDYQRINDSISHGEERGKSGFTGTDVGERLAAAGITLTPNNFAYGEVISASTNTSGFFMAEELITAIYHRFVIFEPVFKEIGTGSGTTARNYTYFTADFLANNGYGPGLGRGHVLAWPYNGQTGVQANFFSNQEEPDPVDTLDEVGYPVSVQGDISAILSVNSFTIKPRGGAVLPVKLLQKSTDKNTPQYAAAIIPLSKLAPATTYDVSFSGAADGVPVSLNWSFTTR